MLPHESHGGSTGYRPPNKTSTGYTLLSPADSVTQCDDELHLTYGAHANRTLFVEYGFVNEVSQQILLRGDIQGEVDVQTPVERLLEARGTLGAWMEGVLKDEGYWGYVILTTRNLRITLMISIIETGLYISCQYPRILHIA